MIANTTAAVTDLLHAAGSKVASPGTELVPATAPRGVPYIATRAEAQIGGAIALEMLAEASADIDVAIIAAFGDPGLFGARELFDIPVVGMAEAAMLTACMLGKRFAIVLDGKIISAPRITEPITGGSGQITGNFTEEETKALAEVLNSKRIPPAKK